MTKDADKETIPIVLGTPYGTERQRRAIAYSAFQTSQEERARLRKKAATRAKELEAPGAIEDLMMPEGIDREHVARMAVIQAAEQHNLSDLQPPQEYNSSRED